MKYMYIYIYIMTLKRLLINIIDRGCNHYEEREMDKYYKEEKKKKTKT